MHFCMIYRSFHVHFGECPFLTQSYICSQSHSFLLLKLNPLHRPAQLAVTKLERAFYVQTTLVWSVST